MLKRDSLREIGILILIILVAVIANCQAHDKNVTLSRKICPPLATNPSTIVTCSFNGKTTDCTNAKVGTIASFKCAQFYENAILKEQNSRTCRKGSWSKKIPNCVPICGIKPSSNYYPWNVALFKKDNENYTFRCAATLVHEKIILTSAHCVTNDFGHKNPVSMYRLGAGKSSTIYTDPEDSEAQFSEVEKIFVPKTFKGSIEKYKDDIAIIVAKSPFNISERIQPVCYDWKNNFSGEFNYPNTTAYIAGPLKSQFFSKLEQVYQIEVPMVNDSECYKMLNANPERANFEAFYTDDKICGGYINSDMVPMCRVDPGVGLISENHYDNKYYLTGITSLLNAVFYHQDSCDNQRWILFTNVTKFSNFIRKKTKLIKI